MLIYNIPARLRRNYSDKTVVVRSGDAQAIVEAFSQASPENLWSIQILSMDCDTEALLHLPQSLLIDLVVCRPATQFPKLYRFAELTRKHQLRMSIKAVPGMTKAVKIAQALNFSVKLELNQPEAPVIEELLALSEYYLRGSTVSNPIEPFHSLFLSFYSNRPTSMWSLQEEDPAVDRYITEDEGVALSERLVSLGIPEEQLAISIERRTAAYRESDECATCEFWSRCEGYFKFPEKSYRCDHVKRIFALLNEAAMELRQDENGFVEPGGADHSDLNASPSAPSSMDNQRNILEPPESSGTFQTTGTAKEKPSSFSIRRLDYRLGEFTLHSWANPETEAVWAPRIAKVCHCIQELEWRSIVEGIRACSLRAVAPHELADLRGMLDPYGLTVITLNKVAAGDSYAAAGRSPDEGEPFNYWCAIGRPNDAQLLKAAQLSHDDETTGHLLGYPACCRDFFNRVWVDEGFIDTSWPMAYRTTKKREITRRHIAIPEASNCNVLLRWLGVRLIFHLPCSFDCEPTLELAEKFIGIGRRAGFSQEMDWLEKMVSLPLEWKASNGVAEITTPLGIISTVTDATAETYRVSYRGSECADVQERSESLTQSTPNSVTTPKLAAVEGKREDSFHSSKEILSDSEWYYTDNGFHSRADMDSAHEPIVKLAAATLSDTGGNVLDLGCGNGALLRKICCSNGHLIPWGVDQSEDRISHARLLISQFSDHFIVADIFNDSVIWSEDREFELIILMLGRLTEVSDEQSKSLLRLMKERARNILVYAYSDYGSLSALSQRTGVILAHKGSAENIAMVDIEKL